MFGAICIQISHSGLISEQRTSSANVKLDKLAADLFSIMNENRFPSVLNCFVYC